LVLKQQRLHVRDSAKIAADFLDESRLAELAAELT